MDGFRKGNRKNSFREVDEFFHFSNYIIWCIAQELPFFYYLVHIFIKIFKLLSETNLFWKFGLNVIVNNIHKIFQDLIANSNESV